MVLVSQFLSRAVNQLSTTTILNGVLSRLMKDSAFEPNVSENGALFGVLCAAF